MPDGEEALPEQPNTYLGPLAIWKNPDLTLAEQRIEQRFTERLQDDLPATFYEYRFRNGRILDTDLARAFSRIGTATMKAGRVIPVLFIIHPAHWFTTSLCN